MASNQRTHTEERPGQMLGVEEQKQVIALAARLQAQHDGRRAEELSVAQLEAAAEEAGIDPAFIRAAAAELEKQRARQQADEQKRKALRHLVRGLAVAGGLHLAAGAALFGGLPMLAIALIAAELIAIPLLLHALAVSGEGYAPGWRLRCPDCGRTKDAAEAGFIRYGATRQTKRILAHCSVCGRLKLILLEPTPPSATPELPAPQSR